MKRYAVFSGSAYYPDGGWDDFRGTEDTLEDAVRAAEARGDDWAHIVDLESGSIVARDWVDADDTALSFDDLVSLQDQSNEIKTQQIEARSLSGGFTAL